MSHEKGYLGPMQDQRLESLGAGLGKQLRRNKNGCLGTYFYVFGGKYVWAPRVKLYQFWGLVDIPSLL